MEDTNWRVKVVADPTFEPVTLAEARQWCRLDEDDTSQDAVILLLLIAMREYAEELTGQSFVQRTLELWLDQFPDDGVIKLPHSPVISVTSIAYLDESGSLVTLEGSPSEWQEDLVSKPARVMPLPETEWPATQEALGAVRVRYVAGYSTITKIPKRLRIWIQARIATLYENREQIISGTIVAPLPRDFVDGLLDGLRSKTMFA